jgi:hypothetical protein
MNVPPRVLRIIHLVVGSSQEVLWLVSQGWPQYAQNRSAIVASLLEAHAQATVAPGVDLDEARVGGIRCNREGEEGGDKSEHVGERGRSNNGDA